MTIMPRWQYGVATPRGPYVPADPGTAPDSPPISPDSPPVVDFVPLTVFGKYVLAGDAQIASDATLRDVIPASLFISGGMAVGATRFRVQHRWGISPDAPCDAQMYFGRQAAAGDPYDFDGKQVQVRWGGLPTQSRVPGQRVVSDWIDFPSDQPFDPTKTYIASFQFAPIGTSAIGSGQTSASGILQTFYLNNVLQAGMTDVSGFSTSDTSLYFVEGIEVEVPDAVTLQAIDGETMISSTTMSHDYYARNGYTYAINASWTVGKPCWSAGLNWDHSSFYPIGCFYGLYTINQVTQFLDLKLNVSIAVTGDSDMSVLLANGIWACGSDTATSTWNAAVMGVHVDEQDPGPPISTLANVYQDGRVWDLTGTHNTMTYGDIGGVLMTDILSDDYYPTPNGSKVGIGHWSTDMYWMAGSSSADWRAINATPMFGFEPSEDQCARGSNFGNMIDVQRAQANGAHTKYGVMAGGEYLEPSRIPIFALIENGDGWLGDIGHRIITAPELNWATWSSIIHGARGLDFFTQTVGFGSPGAAVYDQAKLTHTLIIQLAPVLNSPFAVRYLTVSPHGYIFPVYEADWFNGGIEACVHKYQGAYYIFATTRYSETVNNTSATFTVNDPGATVANVVGEGRSIPIVGGQFTDTFAKAWTVHIYQIG